MGLRQRLLNPFTVAENVIKLSLRGSSIVMFHPGRCGSTVLGDLLNQHPQINWASEIYHRAADADYDGAPESTQTLASRILQSPKRHYGFEVKYLHAGQRKLIRVPWNTYLGQLRLLNCKYLIHLTRRNALRTVVSVAISLARNQWHQSAQEHLKPVTVALDINCVRTSEGELPLLASLYRYQEAEREIANLLAKYKPLILTYEEDIAQDPLRGYRRVCEFLQVEPYAGTAIRFAQTNPLSLRDSIANFDDVSRALQNTPFEWMLAG